MGIEVLTRTLAERQRSVAWWALGIALLVALNVAFYPSVRDSSGLADYSTATIASTMIGTFKGDGPCPGAERACRPASPQRSTMRSLKPLTTIAFWANPGAQWT